MKQLFLFAVAVLCLAGCKTGRNASAGKTAKVYQFPQDWFGKYYGMLDVMNAKGIVQKVPMELHILPTDSVNRQKFNIVYGADSLRSVRDYDMVTVDKAKGMYVLDENNSIGIHSFVIGNAIYDRFQVQGSNLQSVYRLVGNEIQYEIVVSQTDTLSVTGGTDAETPPVIDYRVTVVQKAVLKRKK